MKADTELERFNRTMDQILRVRPEVVKRAMEIDKAERAQKRKAKKPSADRVSNAKD